MNTKTRRTSPKAGADHRLLGRRLRSLRQRARLSMRQLAERAGVSLGYVSGVEAGRISATIAMLRKMLVSLGTDIGAFFAEDVPALPGCVFRREQLRSIADRGRNYTFLLPERDDVRLLMLDEELMPGERPAFETLPHDLAGYVLDGELKLEIQGEEAQVLRPGDSFYVPAGRGVRGRCHSDERVRLVSVQRLPGPKGKTR